MTGATGKESFLYDAFGRRARQQATADSKAIYPMYLQSGQLVAERNLRNDTIVEYVHLNGSLVARRKQAIAGGAWTNTFIHSDFLGSPVAETDAAGLVTRIEKYTPYGEQADGTYDSGPGYTGHVTDSLTGLSYMQQRYYDPTLGRFLSTDPMAASGARFNRYGYGANNPYKFVDPDGREEVERNAPNTCSRTGADSCSGSYTSGPEAKKAELQSAPANATKEEKKAIATINRGIRNARDRVNSYGTADQKKKWNETQWLWDPANPEFVKDPTIGAYVNPKAPNDIRVGFRLAEFYKRDMYFTYHNAKFWGGPAGLLFAVLHEFGHVYTQGQGTPGTPARETMANEFAYKLVPTGDQWSITCDHCTKK
jgi:RHS repeat-associated protein